MEELEILKLKCSEQRIALGVLNNKLKQLEDGKPKVYKELLGLIPDKLYLLITNGRRIVCKLKHENKSWVCYTKRKGATYYANKKNIELIKELDKDEEKSYLKSNFNVYEK